MCHCAKTKFCHRHLFAAWLESKLGIQIEEFNSPNHVRKDGYLVKKKIFHYLMRKIKRSNALQFPL